MVWARSRRIIVAARISWIWLSLIAQSIIMVIIYRFRRLSVRFGFRNDPGLITVGVSWIGFGRNIRVLFVMMVIIRIFPNESPRSWSPVIVVVVVVDNW